ncbi:MAG: SCO family protein [Alphaproteobacteria bacterium]|nr:SCO family protein [Alphaproteobacteria bacterium]
MLSFLKHKFSKKDKFFARWGISHLLVALIVGGLMAGWLVLWQHHSDEGRVEQLAQSADKAAAEPNKDLPPDTAKIGGPFSLTSQDGKIVTEHDFPGKYLLVYFGYTSCPDMCPTGLQSISIAMDALQGEGDKVQPLFITVDPARDTPKKIKDYDAAFHPKIIGLTGTAEQIASVAKEYQVFYQKGEGDQDYEVQHTSLIFLMDPNGNLVTTFDEEVNPKAIVAALQKAWGQPAPVAQP